MSLQPHLVLGKVILSYPRSLPHIPNDNPETPSLFTPFLVLQGISFDGLSPGHFS
jgi:hypothetical protein